jgi:hypothetical protein
MLNLLRTVSIQEIEQHQKGLTLILMTDLLDVFRLFLVQHADFG